MQFSVFKVPVTIEYSFFLMLALALLMRAEGLIWVMLFSALHELGHLMWLVAFHKKPDAMRIAFYGIALRCSAALSYGQQFLFLTGGICVNACFCICHIQPKINLSLLLINALPLYPLDGGRIMKLALNQIFSLRISDTVFKSITLLFLAALLIIAWQERNLSLALIGGYILVFSFTQSVD